MAYHFETKDELGQFIIHEVLTTSEALEILGITRQGLNSLVHRGKLNPIKEEKSVKLFFKADILERKSTSKTGRPAKES